MDSAVHRKTGRSSGATSTSSERARPARLNLSISRGAVHIDGAHRKLETYQLSPNLARRAARHRRVAQPTKPLAEEP